MKVGDVTDFDNYINAVIEESSLDNIMSYINYAKEALDAEVIFGGDGNKNTGYFVQPTIIETTIPNFKTMEE